MTPTAISWEGLLYKMTVRGEGFGVASTGVFSQEEVAVTDGIDSHIFISYFSVVDPDEIILDEEDINDPFIHVNIKDIRTYSKEHPHICNSDLFTELIL